MELTPDTLRRMAAHAMRIRDQVAAQILLMRANRAERVPVRMLPPQRMHRRF